MKLKRRHGFTLIELMIVILIIAILAGASIPIMRGKVDEAKWAEAHATAGMIRRAAQVYFLQTGKTVKGKLNNQKKADALGLIPSDLEGTYFVAKNYRITTVDSDGVPTIQVTAQKKVNGMTGNKTLYPNGDWK